MKLKKKKKSLFIRLKGLSLVEVVVAVGLTGVIGTAIVTLMPTLLSNVQFQRDKQIATSYVMDGIEEIRRLRDLDPDTFKAQDGLKCLDADGTLSDGSTCATTTNVDNHQRIVIFDKSDTNNCGTGNTEVTLQVRWKTGRCTDDVYDPYCHKSDIRTCLAPKEAPAPKDGPTATPTLAPTIPPPQPTPYPYIVFYTNGDTFVEQDHPDRNYGNAANVVVDRTNDRDIGYVKFSTIGFPAGRTVVSAYLIILITDTSWREINIFNLNEGFNEYEVNWNRRKQVGNFIKQFVPTAAVGNYHSINMDASWAQGKMNQDYVGLAFRNPIGNVFKFRQREGGYGARLVVYYR